MGSVTPPRREPRSETSHCSSMSRWSPCLEGHPVLTSRLRCRWSVLVSLNSGPVRARSCEHSELDVDPLGAAGSRSQAK